MIKIEFLLTITELVKGEREEKGEIHHVVDIVLISGPFIAGGAGGAVAPAR